MPTFRPFRTTVATLVVLGCLNLPARAVNKDMVQLQTQIQQLQDAVARLQQSNDERMGVLKDLVQQTADSVNKMSVSVDGLKLQMQNQQDAAATKSDQLSGQIQSLNDSLDELKARLARLEKATGDIQGQMQSVTATVNNLPQGSTTPAPGSPIPADAAPAPTGPPAGNALPPQTSLTPAPRTNAAPARDLYATAYGDYMAAKYPLATSEFQALAAAYPDDTLSGNAYFYLGEINLRTQKLTAAVHDYDHLLEHFPDNNKIPAAHLHKAEAMISMKQPDGAARELKALIQRFPNSPEASVARTKLNTLSARR